MQFEKSKFDISFTIELSIAIFKKKCIPYNLSIDTEPVLLTLYAVKIDTLSTNFPMLRITQFDITQTVVKIFKLRSTIPNIPNPGIILWLKFKNTNSHKYAFNKFDILKISTLNKIEVQNIHHMELPRLHLLIDS